MLSKSQGRAKACRVHLGTLWKCRQCLHLYVIGFSKLFHFAVGWSLSIQDLPHLLRRKTLVPKFLRGHGSLRTVCYCRMHGSLYVIRRKAACSQDLEEGWTAGPELGVLTRIGFFGKANFLALTLVYQHSPRSTHGEAWGGAGVPPAIKGVPHSEPTFGRGERT